jgi:anti-sigma factor RsiW
MKRNDACNSLALEALLEDRLNDEEQSALEEHLGNCPACRERLHTEAAEESWWERARRSLTSPEPAMGKEPVGKPELSDEAAEKGSLFGLDGCLAPRAIAPPFPRKSTHSRLTLSTSQR